jgi:hypothetical protein
VIADGDEADTWLAVKHLLQEYFEALCFKIVQDCDDQLAEQGDDAQGGAAAQLAPGRCKPLLRESILCVQQRVHRQSMDISLA